MDQPTYAVGRFAFICRSSARLRTLWMAVNAAERPDSISVKGSCLNSGTAGHLIKSAGLGSKSNPARCMVM